MPDEHAHPAGELGAQLAGHYRQVRPAAGDHVPQPERRVAGQDDIGRRQVGLGQAEQRIEARVIGGHQEAVDQPGPGRRVSQRADDHQLLGVRDDHALDRVGVVR